MSDLSRFVHIGTMGECPAGEDFYAIEDGVPERRILRRMFSNLDSPAVRQELAQSALEVGHGREGRLCAVFEAFPCMPWVLWRPRHLGEAALLALMVGETARVGYREGAIAARYLVMDLHGTLHLRSLWPPIVGPPSTEAALVRDVGRLLASWGFRNASAWAADDWATLARELRRLAPAVPPARWSPPMIGDARALLDVLTDADHKESDRVTAAVRLACVPALAEETCRLLVRALNEPLRELPFVARELLADRMVPVCVFVDGNGLLRRCPHAWTSTEVVHELGEAAVERFCPDCDARVTLPQTIETFEGRSSVADAFAEQGRHAQFEAAPPPRFS